MHIGFRGTLIALAAAASCLGSTAARAGDDGAAPLWEGIGSIFGPVVGLGNEEKDPIDYHEHGKLVVPKSMDLPPPGGSAATSGGAWPVNQEIQRKKTAKENEKKKIAGVGDVRLRGLQGFPNAPVTVRASDQPESAATLGAGAKAESSSVLGNLNPLGWVGLNKGPTTLGPEPDRDWLTDPPKGYRAPVAASPAPTAAAQRPASAAQPSN
ncbi:hypothetical protein DFR50_10559 [Roseiarcus fermentans]|uniref:Uncharacterized protein n=1 Tax=Roseiarcus fermentans TaxID=1473586 RepID=A0A366FP64_9HYPH|nr:hypothetical protein [Roseiarcus fermentans]RBP16418.1 hypothetical protein DFR50_10559 [Roseiarcus fermentans]